MERVVFNRGPGRIPFEIEQGGDATGPVTLRLRGELDVASARALQHRCGEVLRDGDRGITLDLRDLEFIDSTGINTILLVREVCAERNRELMIVRPSTRVMHVFELVGLTEIIDEPPAGA
jgi:anti-sigma B factor antagonist